MGKLSTSGYRSRGRLADLPTATAVGAFNALVASLAPTWWWKADEASGSLVNSGSGGVNAMSATGTPDYQQTLGVFPAVNLDGSTEYFNTGSGVITTGVTQFSVFMMIHPDTIAGGSGYQVVLHTGQANLFESGLLLIVQFNGTLYSMLAFSAGTRLNITSAASAIAAGTSYTIGYRYTATAGFLYINGVQVATGAYASGAVQGGFRVGRRNSTDNPAGNALFDGQFSNVIVWNGSTISAADMAALHTASGL